jgi:hypothetical protein
MLCGKGVVKWRVRLCGTRRAPMYMHMNADSHARVPVLHPAVVPVPHLQMGGRLEPVQWPPDSLSDVED